jgi:hypothetical protein
MAKKRATLRHKGTKNSKSISRKEAQKAQRIPFLFASLALFCGKDSFHFEKNLIRN